MTRKPVEYVELDQESRWAYLKRYYEVASAFYGARDKVIDDAEVERRIRAFKARPAPRVRSRLPLGRWRFTVDDAGAGVAAGYFSEEISDTDWDEVSLPHSLNHVPKDPARFGRTRYRILAPEPGTAWDIWKGETTTWYRSRVSVPSLGGERVAHLAFDGVNLLADVWVNESPVMMGHLGLFPFSLEVTEEMEARTLAEALIAVRVTNHATNTPFLFANGAQVSYAEQPWTHHPFAIDAPDEAWSGIVGARLDVMDRRHLQDVFIRTESIGRGRASLTCRVEVRNESWKRFIGTIRVEIGPWLPEEEAPREAARAKVTVLPLNDGVVEIPVRIGKPRAWSPESPSLSLAHVVLLDESGREIDDQYETFGVRTIRIEGSHFFLNGRKIWPRGTHNMTHYPAGESLICPSDGAIVRDILLHRGMNANCSRWPSDIRMHYGRIAEWADQLGYMISWAGYFEMWTTHPEMELYGSRDVRAVIRSLRNHPSIIVWEMGDEPLMEVHPHRRFRWYERMYDMVAAEDRSRPIIPAGFWCNELVDLVERHADTTLPASQRRRRILTDYPLFTREQAVWDYHYCPYLATNPMAPSYAYVDMVARNLEGQCATVFTEFGIDGMPKPETMQSYYGRFRWASWGLMPVSRVRSDVNYYGRQVGQDDWRETQAAQALVLSQIIGRVRSYPDVFAAYYYLMLVDVWTFCWGVIDAAWNAKLAWFVVRACNAPVLLSGLHGSTVLPRAEPRLTFTASNLGDAISGAELEARIIDAGNGVAATKTSRPRTIAGNGSLTVLGDWHVGSLSDGTYSLEMRLSAGGTVIAEIVELFILR